MAIKDAAIWLKGTALRLEASSGHRGLELGVGHRLRELWNLGDRFVAVNMVSDPPPARVPGVASPESQELIGGVTGTSGSLPAERLLVLLWAGSNIFRLGERLQRCL